MTLRLDWLPLERLDELQAFVDEHWRRGHVLARDAELLRWQHRRRDDRGTLAVLVAEEDGRLLAMLGWIEFDACVGDSRVPGGWMTNWLVVPEARGRGLGIALVEHAMESAYEFIGALGANAATLHVLGAAGFAEVGMHRWVRVFDHDALRELLGGREYHAVPAPPAAGGEGFVGACRDEPFLEWRYRGHPRFRYELLRDESGFAAYRIEQVAGSSAKVMRITDVLGGDSLIDALVDTARRERVVFADFYCTSARFASPLEHVGFVAVDGLPGRFQPLDFSDRPIVSNFWAAPRLGVDFAAGDLYVTRADSDLDRPN
ncbi:MAG TPA: GNAT family N-acetyltransferase [Gaiellaceae bacterium]